MVDNVNKTIFVFSDESSDEKQKEIYTRGSLIIDSFEYLDLKEKFYEIKRNILGEKVKDEEFKFHYLWLKIRYDEGINIKDEKFEKFKHINLNTMIKFIEETFILLKNYSSIKIIYTYSSKDEINNYIINKKFKDLISEHLHIHMQRINMYCNDSNSCACFFLDYDSKNEKLLIDIYNKMIKNGDFYILYKNLKDSLNFEQSEHSVGIQIVDFVLGCFKNFLKKYEPSYSLFCKYIFNKIRTYKGKIYDKDDKNNLKCYGVIVIPTDSLKTENELRYEIAYNLIKYYFNNDEKVKVLYQLLAIDGYEKNNIEYNLKWDLMNDNKSQSK
ncbi:MAG TPA: hypothetical protein PLH46_04475 [Caldisericia bacterium]|nr:hypothetical protein [Caldisericia bacterium]